MPNKKEIGKRIEEKRQTKGLTRKEMAEKIGIPYNTLYAYESGLRIPNDQVKVLIAKFLGISVSTLFFKG